MRNTGLAHWPLWFSREVWSRACWRSWDFSYSKAWGTIGTSLSLLYVYVSAHLNNELTCLSLKGRDVDCLYLRAHATYSDYVVYIWSEATEELFRLM